MKVTIDEAIEHGELEVIIRCKSIDESVLQLLRGMRQNDKKLVGYEKGAMCLIEPDDSYYFESVDKKNFIYTKDKVYVTPLNM